MTAANSSAADVKAGPAAPTNGLEILHSSSGRLRVHLPNGGDGEHRLLSRIKHLDGVTDAEANPHTCNVLIRFDSQRITPSELIEALRTIRLDRSERLAAKRNRKQAEKSAEKHEPEQPAKESRRRSLPDAVVEGSGRQRRARIAVRGLDRDTGLAHKVMQELQKTKGVHVEANLLTGRILVDYDNHLVHLQDLLAKVAELEMPERPGEDEPRHPLDPTPYLHSATHVVGALVGLGFITIRRLFWPAAGGDGVAAAAVGVLTMVQGFPFVRNGMRRVFGEHRSDLVTHGVGLVALTLADIPLGLVMTGVEALLLLGEVTQRRAAWRNYEEGLDSRASGAPGSVLRLEPGMRVPHAARVIEGTGTAIGRSGRVQSLAPGLRAPAGARLNGGPFVLELLGGETFEPQPRPAPPAHDDYRKYLRIAAPLSFSVAAFAGLMSGSLAAAFEALLLLNPRPALVGLDAANLSAASRTLRGGLTIVGTRPKRSVCHADVLILDGPRMLTDGREVDRIIAVAKGLDEDTLRTLAGSVAIAAGSPLGRALHVTNPMPATEGSFDGKTASAKVLGVKCLLRTATDMERFHLPDEATSKGGFVLALLREDHPRPLALIVTRPRLLPGVARLVEVCRECHVELAVLPGKDTAAAHRIADRAGVTLLPADEPVAVIRARQERGLRVAFASDGAHATEAFAQCDTSIGMTAGHAGYFPAQADILAPDLDALSDFVESGRLRARAVRDSVLISAISNAVGMGIALTGPVGIENAIIPGYVSALTALVVSWWRCRGGDRAESTLSYLSDPRPERWGRRPLPSLMRSFHTTADGLSSQEAAGRRVPAPQIRREELLSALGKQFRAPTIALMSGGACLTLILGQPFNTAIIATLTSLNVAAGLWQERQANQAAEALAKLSAPTARVLRDGEVVSIPASEVVTGDILALMPGDRVAGDARVISAESLEVGEATMTGEAAPVTKGPEEASDHHRMVLEGTDVVAGTGRAVVVAVGRRTRLGTTASALGANTQVDSPLGARLARVLRVGVPVAFTGGLITAGASAFYGLSSAPASITLGVTTFLSTIPEGLPMLAAMGQTAVSRRLAKRNAIVRRMAGIEALGRVDVACVDKTGTLTEGRLAVSLVANLTDEVELPGTLPDELRHLLLIGGLACPHPEAANAEVHPTDTAMLRAAQEIGLADELRARHAEEMPFTAARAYHASRVGERVCVKGSPERLIFRCKWLRGQAEPLNDRSRREFLKRTAAFAERGLRVLLVAEGPAETLVNDPEDMTALGIVGINDPLRPDVATAIARCQKAGVRVIMLTGDHPLTATAIGREAGLFTDTCDKVYTASQLHDIAADELDRRLDSAAVIARATPLDKLHIVESLQRRGHTVAMTGDGVNDAPALRLADVGVAMGRTGSEVARQAADVVLINDDFTTLGEALVEGRGFWRNMRHALGLLLGGNAGELALITGTTLAGLGTPLTPPQILAVSLIVDTMPTLAIGLRPPMQRDLSRLSREGLSGLDASLPWDTLRRGLATAVPSLAAYLWMSATAGPAPANAVAFASVISSQLAQTLDVGHVEGMLSKSVLGAVGGSLAMLGMAVGVPGVRELMGLQALSLTGWGIVALSAVAAVAISRSITLTGQLDIAAFKAAWIEEFQRLRSAANRLLPPSEPKALPAPV